MVVSALKLRDKLNNLSRRPSLGFFLESNKLKWSSLGEQTLERKDRTQVLQLKKMVSGFWGQVVRLWIGNCYRKAGLHEKTHSGKWENIVCYIRVNFAFFTAHSCKSYKCGGMEVYLGVYMFLLICSKLICIIVGVCLWSSGRFVCIFQHCCSHLSPVCAKRHHAQKQVCVSSKPIPAW